MPVPGTILKGLIVGILALFNEHLDTDVFAHDESGTIQQEKGKEAAHTAVPVIERVDAEKVQDEDGHQEQRIVGPGLNGIVIPGAEVQHGISCLESGNRPETYRLRSVGVLLGDDIVRILIDAPHSAAAEGIKVTVQLKDAVGVRCNILIGLVDRGQNVPITGYLFLIAVPRLDFLLDDGPQPLVGSIDALDAVGSIGTLDFSNFQHGGEDVGLSFDEEFLATAAFMQARQQGDDIRSEEVFGTVDEIVFVHGESCFPRKYSIFLPHSIVFCLKFAEMMQKKR